MTVRVLAPLCLGAMVVMACLGCGARTDTPDITPASGLGAASGTLTLFPPVPLVPIKDRVASDNLLQNGGFEQPAAGNASHELPWWTISAGSATSIELTEDVVAEGRYALRLGMEAGDAVSATQDVQLPAGELFLLRGLVYAQDLRGSVFLSGRGVELSDAEVRQGTQSTFEADGTRDTWWLGQCEFLSPRSPTGLADVAVRCGYLPTSGASGPGALYLDGFELYRLSTIQCVTYGDFETANDVGKVGSWSDDEFIHRSDDAFEGRYALELAQNPGKETMLTGVIVNWEPLRGKRVWASAMVKAPGAGGEAGKSVTLRMRFIVNGQMQYESTTHPGGAEYVELNLIAIVPTDLGPDTNPFTMQLVRDRGVEGPVLMDNVSVLVKAMP